MSAPLDRRRFLVRSGALAAGMFLGAGCGLRPGPRSAPTFRLPPVRVSSDRVIRTLAGLRPYRPSGFVVSGQRLDDTPVIHNYGHGGGGISLSWGSSTLAGEIALETGHRSFAVLGCGILGLTTARILQDRGCRVTIYARELPPHTTSNIGGGQWSPFTVYDSSEVAAGFLDRFERAARLAHARFQTMVGPRYGIRWIENFSLRSGPSTGSGGRLGDLYMDRREMGPGEHPFPTPYAQRYTTMLIEPNVFLPAVMDDVLLRGGRIRVRAFHEPGELRALDEPAVVNCTGIGSRELFGDDELVPIKGQLAVLLPQPEVNYITLAGGSYMFPRSDGIVLGGSQERDEWSPEPTPEVVERILEGNRAVFEGMAT